MISFKYSTRLVILLKNIVIKIPLSKRGYLQGLNEKKIWDKYKHLDLLAELKWMHLGVVCHKRYTAVRSIPDRVVLYAKKAIPEFNIPNCDLYNSENWGAKDNQYMLLDYGINKQIANLYKKQQQSYSEEDLKQAFLDGWQLRDGDLPFPKAKNKWFNEFKKQIRL